MVNSDRVQETDKDIYVTMTNSIQDFFNNTIWTGKTYKSQEKINCSVIIAINQRGSSGYFNASLQIFSNRPVHDGSYITPVFSFHDKEFDFEYIEFQSIDFQKDSYISNLSSVLAFYAYSVIGLDKDCFSPLGGTEEFMIARDIAIMARNNGYRGWDSTQRRNRYSVIKELLDNRNKDFRLAFYDYHINGLDIMSTDLEKGKVNILKSLDVFKKFRELFLIQTLIEPKVDEIINIYDQYTTEQQKNMAKEILTDITSFKSDSWNN
ncbi:hypothetical protein JBKA6_1224 [Ichthyobacterium seriolicida]|uniref:DUF4835 domain-containing protein n=2 Tax=Ichthyobacterium seriolicida TaxID=242600 RepID=A0A1J1E2Q8_9FLAO|nr:hypothetical protein JBKA6_1224 [Ichthyobacterium seriolicida]